MVTFAHTILHNGRSYQFVKDYLGKDLPLAKVSPSPSVLMFKFLCFAAVILFLPFIYAHTAMEYPCKVVQLVEAKNATLLTHGKADNLVSRRVGCEVQDFLRSPDSVLFGPAALVIYWAFGTITLLL